MPIDSVTYVSQKSSQLVDVALVSGEVLDEFRIRQPLGQGQHKLVGLLQILRVLAQFSRMRYQIL